jgi:hypothetical protein
MYLTSSNKAAVSAKIGGSSGSEGKCSFLMNASNLDLASGRRTAVNLISLAGGRVTLTNTMLANTAPSGFYLTTCVCPLSVTNVISHGRATLAIPWTFVVVHPQEKSSITRQLVSVAIFPFAGKIIRATFFPDAGIMPVRVSVPAPEVVYANDGFVDRATVCAGDSRWGW